MKPRAQKTTCTAVFLALAVCCATVCIGATGFVVFRATQPSVSTLRSSLSSLSISSDSGYIADKDLFTAASKNTARVPAVPRKIQICQSPRIFVVRDMLSRAEASMVIAEAAQHLDRSRTGGFNKSAGDVSAIRTSLGMFMQTRQQIEMVRPIAERVSKVVGVPWSHFEAMQVLDYKPGQYYIPHPDYFEGAMLAEQNQRGGQRMATFIMYLNDVPSGGATTFPRLNVAVTPQLGTGVLFWSQDADGKVNPNALHSGEPPAVGSEKWIAVYWIREKAFF